MRTKHLLPLISILTLGLILAACNFPFSVEEPPEVGSVDLETEAPPQDTEEVIESLPATDTPLPPTETPTPTLPPPTNTPVPTGCTDRASFVTDVTYPDDSEVDSGASFAKTWRLRNDGTCTWTSSYALVFSHGDQMGGPVAVPLAGAVSPGNVVDLSVNLTAPVDPGTYQGFWMLRNNESVLFGIGADGSVAFWVKIVVPSEDPIVEIPPLLIEIEPILLIYKASGTDVNVHDNGCFDLDEGVSIGCGSPEADFQYEHSLFLFVHEYEIDPIHGSKFKLFGSSKPTSEQCQAIPMSGATFELKKRYYCYLTSAGKYGWIKIKNYNSSVVLFDFGTFNLP